MHIRIEGGIKKTAKDQSIIDGRSYNTIDAIMKVKGIMQGILHQNQGQYYSSIGANLNRFADREEALR